MHSNSTFGALLARVRAAQGFPSAYAFYKQRGGRGVLGATFRNYVNLEQGKSLPKPETLAAILPALGLEHHSDTARELVDAYYAALGLEPLERYRRPRTPAPETAEAASLEGLAVERVMEKVAVQISLEQWKVLAANFANNACHLLLLTTPGGVDASELAALTGLKPAAVGNALKALAAAGLAEVSQGRARSPFDRNYVRRYPQSPEMDEVVKALRGHHERFAEMGTLLRHSTNFIHLDDAGVRTLLKHVDHLMETSAICEAPRRTPDSATYMLLTRLFRLFPAAKAEPI